MGAHRLEKRGRDKGGGEKDSSSGGGSPRTTKVLVPQAQVTPPERNDSEKKRETGDFDQLLGRRWKNARGTTSITVRIGWATHEAQLDASKLSKRKAQKKCGVSL